MTLNFLFPITLLYIIVLIHSIIFYIVSDDVRTSELFFTLIKSAIDTFVELLRVDSRDLAFDFLNLEYICLDQNERVEKPDISFKIRPMKCYKLINPLTPQFSNKSIVFTKKSSQGALPARDKSPDVWNLNAFKTKNRFEKKYVVSPMKKKKQVEFSPRNLIIKI